MPVTLKTYYPALADDTVTFETSPTQALVLDLVCAGYTNGQIATKLHMTVDAVKSALRNVMGKAGATTRSHFVALIYSGAATALVPVTPRN